MNKEQEKLYAKKAVRRGKIYCAPWCGGGCTWAAFQDATKRADVLVAKLNAIGGKWKPRVWENLGWHYEAKSALSGLTERFNVTEYDDHYTVWMGHFTADGKTPRDALHAARSLAMIDLSSAQLTFNVLTKSLGDS